ncbi:MAG TPA: 3-phosphoshikimate 1-carboxyvinyltransferase, partial [Candidatus Thermoplasmatota archaeon]|nr:3-phosphoshikimate 1-carboxyvinyltransferase [Candidatus Thermoplasmatota archaeon]
AAQAAEPCTVRNPLQAGGPAAMLACLQALGARPVPFRPGEGALRFEPAALRAPAAALDCRGAGTALRLLAATAARLGPPALLTGDASLRARPNGPLLDALRSLGAQAGSSDGRAPLRVRGPLRSGAVRLPARCSSQFASALLLSLPFVAGDSTVALEAPVASRPYLDVTLQAARHAGLRIEPEGDVFHVPGGQAVTARVLAVEGDWSSAAFPLAAAAATGGAVRVTGLDPRSVQGDRAIVPLLRFFGARVQEHDDGASCTGGPLASPGPIDVAATPDLFPILAVVAAASHGTTTFTGGAGLRGKESDRIAAMAHGLARMGVAVRERPDGLVVTGGALRGARVACRGDHRIHMAFAVAGLAAQGETVVEDAASAAASYPSFHVDLARLGALGAA